MPAPDARFTMGACNVHLLGTVAGYVPDGLRVREACAEGIDGIAFCVPEQDLSSLDRLRAEPALMDEMALPDDLEERRLGGLGNFGETQIPSPDVLAAHDEAHLLKVPLVAVDLDDVQHTQLYTKLVKFRHVIQGNSARNKLRKIVLTGADAYEYQTNWETTLLKSKGHQRLEEARLEHVVREIRNAAPRFKRLLVVVPTMHFARIQNDLKS